MPYFASGTTELRIKLFFYDPNIVGEMFIEFFDLLAKLEKAMRKPILVIPRNLPTL